MKKALAAAVLVLCAVGVSSFFGIRRQSADAAWVEHTHVVLQQLDQTFRFVIDARRSANAYVLSNDLERLRRCYEAQHQTQTSTDRLAALTADNPGQQQRIAEFRGVLVQERAGLDRLTSTRDAALVRAPAWIDRFSALQRIIDAMTAEEERLLVIRTREKDASVRRTQLIVAGGDVLAFALVLASFSIWSRESGQRQAAEARLSATNQELTFSVADLQRRSNELALLSRMGRLLQSCEQHDEVGGVVQSIFPELFHNSSGAAYMIAASRNLVSPVAIWPEGADAAPFVPSDCWALRSGVIHRSWEGMTCKHAVAGAASICVPLIAHGETLGLLHIQLHDRESIDVASAAAEQLSLAAANINMQETLRRQAMRDPLTGVFNRRYMEETLEREIHRAARQKTMIGVVLLDLDHFKAYNDTLGHAAGDDLLRSAAGIMQRAVRADDVVCRYGGDEFVIIMPDALAEVVENRAKELHNALGQLPSPVTSSIGIAIYPVDATAGKDLLVAADGALYRAKRAGRARIARAKSPDAAASGR